MFVTAYIIGGSLVAYQIGYVVIKLLVKQGAAISYKALHL